VAHNGSSLGLALVNNGVVRPRGNSHQSKIKSGGKIHLMGAAPSNQRNIYSNFQVSNTYQGQKNSSSRRNKRSQNQNSTLNQGIQDNYDNLQIGVAEQAINEMRNNLNQNKKAGEQYHQLRPKS
jgi:hypothetical protein